MKEEVYLLERCWPVLHHAGSVVEVAYELVVNHHALELKEYWSKLWYV
jgi:hypothetical protein